MAPTTRSKVQEPGTPEKSTRPQYSTPKKSRFYKNYEQNHGRKSMAAICREEDISRDTGYRWINDKKELGQEADRTTRKKSKVLGRHSRVSKDQCKWLCNISNPDRFEPLDVQIENNNISIKPRALRTQIAKNTNGGKFYTQAYTKKEISAPNARKREEYGEKHEDKTVDNFWQWVIFTDEAHIDPSLVKTGKVLREEGPRLHPLNIQQKPKRVGNKLHIAGWANWHTKCKFLEFYHDEEDQVIQPKHARKPRKRKAESQETYEGRLREWEATLPHPKEVKPKGNAMTQQYYVKRLLPVYISAIKTMKEIDDKPWILQEDNDKSHGHVGPVPGVKFMAQEYRETHGIKLLIHPPQSPDLNPIEACWNILKERMRKYRWNNLDELKALLQKLWNEITMEKVQARIAEMPWRCKQVKRFGGKPVKSELW
jgi:transposase